jgi:hypothetical protein
MVAIMWTEVVFLVTLLKSSNQSEKSQFQFFSEWFALVFWGGDVVELILHNLQGDEIFQTSELQVQFCGEPLGAKRLVPCQMVRPPVSIDSYSRHTNPCRSSSTGNVLCNDLICHSFRGVPLFKSLHTELMLTYRWNFAGWIATCKLCNNPECNTGSSTLLQKKFEMENNIAPGLDELFNTTSTNHFNNH